MKFLIVIGVDYFCLQKAITFVSMEDFLKVVLILLAVYFGIKWLFRLLLPLLMRYFARKFQQRVFRSFEQQNESVFRQFNSKNKQTTTSSPKKNKKPVGEYIDFEEIE